MRIPIKVIKGVKWGDLNSLCLSHVIVAEHHQIEENYSFQGGHRVRRFKLKKNVHWLIPVDGVDLDITAVTDSPPRKQTNGRR